MKIPSGRSARRYKKKKKKKNSHALSQGIWLTGQPALRLISRNTLRDCYSAPPLPRSKGSFPVNSTVNYPLIGCGDQLRGVISFVFRLSFLHRWPGSSGNPMEQVTRFILPTFIRWINRGFVVFSLSLSLHRLSSYIK